MATQLSTAAKSEAADLVRLTPERSGEGVDHVTLLVPRGSDGDTYIIHIAEVARSGDDPLFIHASTLAHSGTLKEKTAHLARTAGLFVSSMSYLLYAPGSGKSSENWTLVDEHAVHLPERREAAAG